jgi:hypothetical protein
LQEAGEIRVSGAKLNGALRSGDRSVPIASLAKTLAILT